MSSAAPTIRDSVGSAGVQETRGHRARHDTMLRLVVRRFLRHRMATAGLFILVLLVLSAVLAPVAPHDPNALSTLERKQGPSADHWFGTDKAGRDIFARTLWGG